MMKTRTPAARIVVPLPELAALINRPQSRVNGWVEELCKRFPELDAHILRGDFEPGGRKGKSVRRLDALALFCVLACAEAGRSLRLFDRYDAFRRVFPVQSAESLGAESVKGAPASGVSPLFYALANGLPGANKKKKRTAE